MKITVAVDNSLPIGARAPLLGEHGSALLIETAGRHILLDSGQSGIVVHNLSLLGIHVDQLDAAAVSHGHYDHTGGLFHILTHRRKELPVYGHPDIFQARFAASGANRRYNGVPYSQAELTSQGAVWKLSAEPQEIAPRLFTSGQVPRRTDYELGDAAFVLEDDARGRRADMLTDDMSLYYAHRDGLVVISGCAHAGLVNTVEHGFCVTGAKRLLGWIGGTHLGSASTIQQERTLEQIERYGPRFLCASHCTGFPVMAELYHRMGKVFIHGAVGGVVEVEE